MPQVLDSKLVYSEFVLDVNKPAAQLTTAFVALRENTSGGVEKIVGLELINTTGAAQTVSAEIVPENGSTGTAANLILDAFSVAAHTRERLYSVDEPFFLDEGETLSLKANANTAITARLFVESPRPA